jgi:amino acid adenylation domain-containing protein
MSDQSALTLDKLTTLSATKAQLLKLLMEQDSRDSESIRPYARIVASDQVLAVASWAQQRLWFVDQLEGGSPAYHIVLTVRLCGSLQEDSLEKALTTLVARHETLRTVFTNVDGVPHQKILPYGVCPLGRVDLSDVEPSLREQSLEPLRQEEFVTPFDLERGPLIRARLVRLGAAEHVLLVTMHHIISDGWSVGVFFRELTEIYRSDLERRPHSLQPLPIQYADGTQWQRDWLIPETLEVHLNYWRTQLAGATPQLELPNDTPRPVIPGYRGANLPVLLEPALCAQLKAIAQQRGMTLFMMLYAAWAVLMARLSGQADVAVGTPIANRQRPELEDQIGFFVNTLVLRVSADADSTVESYLEQVKATVLGAYAHQDAPFEQVVEALRPERRLNRNPLFQVMFALQNAPRSEVHLPGLIATVQDPGDEPAMFDLLVSLEERGAEIHGSVNYATDLFRHDTIQRWIKCYKVLLKELAQARQERLGDLEILPTEERHQVTVGFNATERAYPADLLVHELFESQVREHPSTVAVIHAGQQLTYAELNGRANQLARHLRNHGIGPDDVVGICLERSVEMVIGVLAILKAGGAYLPLDPNYPSERLEHMLQDAAPRVVLTQRQLIGLLPESAAEKICLSETLQHISSHSDENLLPASVGLSPQHLVYLIYTSGSTGRPKGTAMPHRAMVNLMHWHREIFGTAGGSGNAGAARPVLQFAALSFDVAFQEIFSTLCGGDTLVLLDEWKRRDANALTQLLNRERVERLFVPPLLLQTLAEHCVSTGDVPRCLRDVITAGEQLRVTPQIVQLFGKLPGVRLHNHYGPTETHVVTALTLTGEPQDWPALPSIGQPIANSQLYVLDANRRPVPIGVSGEIYIGGAGVARGYRGRPELTAQRFIEDPFQHNPGAKLYRTGDVGRWTAEGTLEYLGRNDSQVKIRGYRIELGEIESHLSAQETVRDAVVMAREDVPGEKRLVGYVRLREAEVTTAEQLREQLKAVLPDYMVPTAVVVLQEWPLSPNGKLDRRALPAPELDAVQGRAYEPPHGELEEALAEIWQELLHIQRVGRNDSFFELGGHSLLLVQMLDRLKKRGYETQVREIYARPKLSDLASILRRAVASEAPITATIPAGTEIIIPEMVPLAGLSAADLEALTLSVPGGAANIQDIYPLAPLQEGLLFHHLLGSEKEDVYSRSLLLAFSHTERLEQFVRALQQVIDRHDILRTAILWEQLPRPMQVVYRRATLTVDELPQQGRHTPLERLKQRMHTPAESLDLRYAPLLRLTVAYEGSNGKCYALLETHHLVCDNQSLQTLLAEVTAGLEGRLAELPQPSAYREHVARTLDRVRPEAAEAFFRDKLGTVDEPTAPFGLLDVHGDGSRIEQARRELAPALSEGVRSHARRLGVSPAALFHAAWGLVVSGTSAREDIVFGTVLLGRLQAGTAAQSALGLFINTLPLRLQLQNLSARELVDYTNRELVALFEYEQTSLAVAQRCSGLSPSTPLFSALLNFLHVGFAQEMRAAPFELIASKGGTSYPLVLSVEDHNGPFVLEVETDGSVAPERVLGYTQKAMESLLQALEESPSQPALELDILPQSERQQVVETFNPTARPHCEYALIHRGFEEQVRRTPNAIAAVFQSESITYRELNQRANQLARHLQSLGAGPDKLVGLCMERGLELMIGIVGILKAGAAYLPLDPASPPDRIAYMLDDAQPAAVVIQDRVREKLPAGEFKLVTLDQDGLQISGYRSTDLETLSAQEVQNPLAYVIYTSGSTGNPKGVMVEHRQVTRLFSSTADWFQFDSHDVWTLFHSFAFDFSVWEIWGAWLHGGRLVVVPQATARSPEDFYRLLCDERVTVLNQTPGAFAQLSEAQAHHPEAAHSLRYVVFGGEALDLSTLRTWVARNPIGHPHLINMYGITETTVHVTYRRLSAEEIASDRSSPIGEPIADLRIYVLNAARQPVPIGVTGEIYVGGAGVARGYLNRAQLTEERFVPDPFSSDPGARMYKSGDLARWRGTGSLEYLGRNDQQVKIRGFRIELGEIEERLARHPAIRQAVVVPREDVPGEKRLIAYVTAQDPQPATPLNAEELRTYLKALLPEYMVPAAFVTLDRLPLTQNGKLDRRALPAPQLGAYVSGEYEAPRGEVEEVLAGIWQTVLRVEQVGRQDNFFELGGHSLLIVQVMSRLRRIGLATDARRIFDNPVLADLARALTPVSGDDFQVPPALIPADAAVITPDMLPLIALEPAQIQTIVESVPGGAANVKDIYPLAPLQEGILFHHMLAARGGDAYVVPTVLAVDSLARLKQLIEAIQSVIDRHDVLRTAILWENLPQPVQVVYRNAPVFVEDLALDPDDDAPTQALNWAQPERQQMDLRHAPLIRLGVAPDPQSEQWFVRVQVHHIICDHMTTEWVIAEVLAYLEGRGSELPDSAPYRVHVAQALAATKAQDAGAFFRRKLADVSEPTAPFGVLDVHGDGSAIRETIQALDPGLARSVRSQARALGVSAATVFHAAWGLTLAHLCSREDVVFGSVLLGRLQGSAGGQRTLGMFINTLPLRLTLKGLTARALVERTQKELIELLDYEQASLAVAQRCSSVDGATPLFSTLLNYRHSQPGPETNWDSAEGIRLVTWQDRTNYPITLSVDDLGDELTLTAQTHAAIDPSRIVGFMRTALTALVEALQRTPEKSALELEVLPTEERYPVTIGFNTTERAYPADLLVHELFEAQVREHPGTVAVTHEDEQLTYAELNGCANRLARHLRNQGVGPDDVVGICLERSVEMVIGVLAILKAGGAYLPLDPNYPSERLEHMLQDAAPRVVLTQRQLIGLLPESAAEKICLSETLQQISSHSDENLLPASVGLSPQHLVYLIYTSGSTGRPKGTAMPHRAMVNLMHWHREIFGTAARGSAGAVRPVLQFAALSFDVAFQEIFSTLCGGDTLVLLDEWKRRDANALIQLLNRERVERLFVPPLLLQTLAEHCVSTGVFPRTLRDIITAGEQLRVTPQMRQLFRKLPGARLHNHYGPTETHVVTALTLKGDPQEWPALPSIGQPLANSQLYVLDANRRPVPIGVSGEIYIGGAGVARGYRGRPELTAQRFIGDPFQHSPGAKLYRTGDVGRWTAEGTLEYLGRNDSQVKIRGYRIELGEIESHLSALEAVSDAVVMAREDVPGEKRLVGYVRLREAEVTTAEQLREQLKAVLPDYMVPTAVVVLQEWPLSPNGKLDRRALPAPELDATQGRTYEPPQGELEEALAGIWQELLHVQRVSRNDSFFELGGHSLHIMKLNVRIQQRFRTDISVASVFRHPRLHEIAANIASARFASTFSAPQDNQAEVEEGLI